MYVTVERRGRVAIVRYDRGDKANALSFDGMRELTAAARSFEDDCETTAIVLTGGAVFSMGFDLKDGAAFAASDPGVGERRARAQVGRRMAQAWERVEPITIAAVEGWAVGGGAVLACACDLRVMGAGAQMYVPEIERGMNLSWAGVPRLVSLVGPARAKRIMILAEKIGAARAEAWGLCDEIAPDGGALDAALALAERFAAMPPVQVRMIKAQVEAAASALSDAVSALDADQFALSQMSEDSGEAVAAFLEKRDPSFTGR